MQLSTQTIAYQKQLAQYCKTGNSIRIPGVQNNRIEHYRELVFNAVYGNLTRAFPLTIEIVGEEQFTEWVDIFFKEHDCHTPQIWLLPKEFCEFAQKLNWSNQYNLPWLNDLFSLEWLESELFTMKDIPSPTVSPLVNPLNQHIVTTAEFRMEQLSYPVHIMSVEKAIENKGEYFVLGYRLPTTKLVHFFNVSALHAIIIEQLQEQNTSLQEIIDLLASELNLDTSLLTESIPDFITDLYNKGFVLGARVGVN